MSEPLGQRVERLIQAHAQTGVLLDTNVLLLLIAAQLHPAAIGQGRLSAYTPDDALLLRNCVARFSQILTTAHVLAETSNLAKMVVHGRLRDNLFANLYPLFCFGDASSLQHLPVPSHTLDSAAFVRLGLTDAGLAALATDQCLLLTDDLDLYVAVVTRGAEAINFTHMREAAGLL